MIKKKGVLFTDGTVEPSIAWELYSTENENWFLDGWSLDAVSTANRGGLGVAKDLYGNNLFAIDAGLYATLKYSDIKSGVFKPTLGAGINIDF